MGLAGSIPDNPQLVWKLNPRNRSALEAVEFLADCSFVADSSVAKAAVFSRYLKRVRCSVGETTAILRRGLHPSGFAVYILLVLSIFSMLWIGLRASRGWTGAVSNEEDTRYDAGQVFGEETSNINRRFRITNRSKKPIKLLEQRCSCTCTTSHFAPEYLPPGESGVLDMSVRTPGGYSGKTNIRCELSFDDGSTRVCSVDYESFPRIMAELSNVDLGSFPPKGDPYVEPPATVVHVSTFSKIGEEPLSVLSVRAPDEVRASIAGEPTRTVLGGIVRHRYEIRFSPVMDTIQAHTGASAVFKPANILANGGVSTFITLTWRNTQPYSCSPSILSFGSSGPGDPPKSLRASVSSYKGTPISIESISSDSPFLKVVRAAESLSDSPSSSVFLQFVLSPPPKVDDLLALAGKISIVFADGKSSVLTVPWSAFVRRPSETRPPPKMAPRGAGKEGRQ